MSANLAVVKPAPIPTLPLVTLFPECKFTPVSLEIKPGMKFDRWLELGDLLRLMAKGIQFYVGDWIRYGEHEYGEMYSQAIEATGKEEATLQNWVFVAQNIHSSRRRELDQVDFSTHAEVASLPAKEQERILSAAASGGLSKMDVRREVKRTKHRLNPKTSELAFIHTPAAQAYLDKCHAALQALTSEIPDNVPSLRILNSRQRDQINWQKERTVEGDCAAILELFTGDGKKGFIQVEYAGDSEIWNWMYLTNRIISDPDLDDRLELLSLHSKLEQDVIRKNVKLRERGEPTLPLHRYSCSCLPINKKLAVVDQGGRKDTQRGDLGDLYALYEQSTGDSANVSRGQSRYDSGERE